MGGSYRLVPMAARRALITGIAGQDGSLLAELLLDEGYDVFGIVRRATSEQFDNLAGIRDRIELVQADLLDELSLVDALRECRPHEVFNLASPSFVPMSWKQPVLTAEFAAVGVTALLESIRLVDAEIRFYQASSSEIFGEPREVPQTEETALSPVTPYGVAKAYGHLIVRSYRRRYGLYVCSGILYNHESPRRPLDFVTRKIAHAAAAISLGLAGELWLGDLDARRDWGYAGDYVRAMALMLRHRRVAAPRSCRAARSDRRLREGACAAGVDADDRLRRSRQAARRRRPRAAPRSGSRRQLLVDVVVAAGGVVPGEAGGALDPA
jgi:GDPmannose 4,6-dehydratase